MAVGLTTFQWRWTAMALDLQWRWTEMHCRGAELGVSC